MITAEKIKELIAKQLDTTIFNSKISACVSIAEAPAHGESIFIYSPKSKGAKEYLSFINELIEPNKMNKSKKTAEEK